jgi:wobble nucleotide-excising tRNase
VFNRDFIDQSIFQTDGELDAIYVFGKDSADGKKRIEELKQRLKSLEPQRDAICKTYTETEEQIDAFYVDQARNIKQQLRSAGDNPYQNYNKQRFEIAIGTALPLPITHETPSSVADEKHRDNLAALIRAERRTSLTFSAVPRIVSHETFEEIRNGLSKSVVVAVLQDLRGDSQVAEWVQRGLSLHSGGRNSPVCRFCQGEIKPERLVEIEEHFNLEYQRWQEGLRSCLQMIKDGKTALERFSLHDVQAFYPQHHAAHSEASGILAEYRKRAFDAHEQLQAAINARLANPFSTADAGFLASLVTDLNALHERCAASVALLATAHEEAVRGHTEIVTKARKDLHDILVCDAIPRFSELKKRRKEAEDALKPLNQEIRDIETEMQQIATSIQDHRRPAQEITDDLQNYLGRAELSFESAEDGYRVMRHGLQASHLSEGEKTAIAFLYFLKSLESADFDLQNDVVVIDDPISSLDSNALFSAFAYMSARTQEAGQLFVLTHNFAFFRQVQDWLRHCEGGVEYYMLDPRVHGGSRAASIRALDPLLRNHASEYHFLFKSVLDCSRVRAPSEGFNNFYPLPNMARRLLEAFLAFRFPNVSKSDGKLWNILKNTKSDPGRRLRLLRFLHHFSHLDQVVEPHHDLSSLNETPSIMQDVLKLIEEEDPMHYKGMLKAVGYKASDDASA